MAHLLRQDEGGVESSSCVDTPSDNLAGLRALGSKWLILLLIREEGLLRAFRRQEKCDGQRDQKGVSQVGHDLSSRQE